MFCGLQGQLFEVLTNKLHAQNPSNHAAHQEASSTLLAFRNSQGPVAVCQHILDHSISEQAKFQVYHSGILSSSLSKSAQCSACNQMCCRLL